MLNKENYLYKDLPKNIILYGGTGAAISATDIVNLRGSKVVAIIDDYLDAKIFLDNIPIFKKIEELKLWLQNNGFTEVGFLICIGNPHSEIRLNKYDQLLQLGFHPISLIHPSAIVSQSAQVESGVQVLAGAIVGAGAKIGKCCIVNQNAVVEHEVILEPGVEVCTSGTILGLTKINQNSTVGAGSVVLSRLQIGEKISIPAGIVIGRSIQNTSEIRMELTNNKTH